MTAQSSTPNVNQVHLNDGDLADVEQGRGDPVIFVHGSLGDSRHWGGQVAPFGER